MSRIPGNAQGPLIIGHYGGSNTGDEAMLAGLLKAIGPDARRHATVVVKKGALEKSCPDLAVSTVPATMSSVLSGLRRSGCLVLGGGTHFHDDYTTSRYLRHFRYMSRIVTLSVLAKLLGKKVAWLGMGFGPFYRVATRWLTRLGLTFCDCVTARDERSYQEVAAWVSSRKLARVFDLSALLVDGANGEPCSDNGNNGHREYKTLGISATSVENSMTGGPQADAVFWDRLTQALIGALNKDPKIRVRVMVIRGGDREDDWRLSLKLHDAVSRVHPGRSDLVPYNPNPTVTLRNIMDCDAFIATRYHAGVLAYLSERPLLLIAYHRKVRDLAAEIGLPDAACVSISGSVGENHLLEKITRMLEGDDAFRSRLPLQVAAQRAWLNVQALQTIMPALNPDANRARLDGASNTKVLRDREPQAQRKFHRFRLIPRQGDDPTAS